MPLQIMKLKTKKRLTNFCIGIYFMLVGIEYAVILPTIWFYLSDVYQTQPYFLGLCISSFSLSGLLASPLFGKWYDKTQKTKFIIIFSNLWEIAGNFLYFANISQYFVLISRFIAGVGTGSTSVIFAHIARTTTEKERTAAMTLTMALREIGLLFGPGLNIFLASANFYIGPFHVNKYTAPGIFMCVLWVLMQIVMVFIYFDIPCLEEQEKILAAELLRASQHLDNEYCEVKNATENKDYEVKNAVENTSKEQSEESSHWLNVGNYGNEDHKPEEMSAHSLIERTIINTSPHLPTCMSSSFQEPYIMTKSLVPRQRTQSLTYDRVNQSCHDNNHEKMSCDLHVDNATNNGEYDVLGSNDVGKATEDTNSLDHNGEHVTSAELKTAMELAQTEGSDIYPGKWTYSNEYIKEEVVVLLTVQFFFSFNQCGLEAVLTPLTQKYLEFGEFQNSLIFCGAGVEILLVFVAVIIISKKVQDRLLLVIGLVLSLMAVSWILYFLPTAKRGDPYLLLILVIPVVVDVAGLPFLAAVVVSLYSKVTTDRTQGLSQGIRRVVDGIGTILGPLWASGTFHILYLNFGVMEGLLVLLFLMMVVSWKKLKPTEKYWWVKENKMEDIDENGCHDNDETRLVLPNNAQSINV